MTLSARPGGVSSYLRRDLGIWTALLALVHVVFALQHHVNGRVLYYFFATPEMGASSGLRLDAFGISNWVGLMAALGLSLLLALSNDRSLRRLGPRRWKLSRA
jgi:DMSO/TMAO reductase YedYZ heme-binding membrane subunit